MQITAIPAQQLTAEQLAVWSEIQLADSSLDSPYFRPEFTLAVAAVRNDVEVAVLEEGGEYVGFLPFQRTSWNTGKPVGGKMSDFQGVIARKGLTWDATELIWGSRLSAWDFDHVLASQEQFCGYHWKVAPSPYMDLSGGFEAYRGTVQGQTLAQVQRKSRKLEREVGPLRFEANCTDPKVFQTVIDWKTEQYHRTKALNIFAFDWTKGLLEQIWRQQSADFSGVLTAVYAGDQLAAAHFGMRSRGVLHCWFPVYNLDLPKYSPGLILWSEFARAAQQLGISRIDFGKGDGQYKTSFMSGATPVAEGFVACQPLSRLFRQGSRQAREWIRSSPLRAPARMFRQVHSWLTF